MSDRRRRNRIQGGWSKPTSALKPQTTSRKDERQTDNADSTKKIVHGQMLESKPLVYKDPKKSKMPSRKPYNFSWVVPGLLAGSGLPRHPAEVQYFIDEKIDMLVSLTEWKPALHLAPGLRHVHLPVAEFEPPSLKQASDFVSLVEEAAKHKKKVAVHCHWGLGRTGSMIACYLLKTEGLGANEAIWKTRQARPYSVETHEQEKLIYDYYDLIHKEDQ